MNKGILCARRLISDLYITSPNEIPINEIIEYRGPFINYRNIKGAEGIIISKGDYCIITVSSNISDEGKRNFVLGHELGHFEMHKSIRPVFSCKENDLWDWSSNKKFETEANYFASEILMPKDVFISESRKEAFSIKFLDELKDKFKVSITCAAIRYSHVGYDPIILICSRNNKIEWFFRNESFPYYIDISKGNIVPQNTVAYEYFTYGKTEEPPQDINPLDWNIKADIKNNLEFYEQCIYAKNYGYVLSFISVGK